MTMCRAVEGTGWGKCWRLFHLHNYSNTKTVLERFTYKKIPWVILITHTLDLTCEQTVCYATGFQQRENALAHWLGRPGGGPSPANSSTPVFLSSLDVSSSLISALLSSQTFSSWQQEACWQLHLIFQQLGKWVYRMSLSTIVLAEIFWDLFGWFSLFWTNHCDQEKGTANWPGLWNQGPSVRY